MEFDCNSISIDTAYRKYFGIFVCRECKWKDKFKCLTKTNGKKEYLLSDGDINSLKHWITEIKSRNGDNNGGLLMDGMNQEWRPKYMKLYLKYQLEELSIEKWGSLQGIEAERNRREVNRMQRNISMVTKKKMKFECLDDIEINHELIEKEKKKENIFMILL